MFNQMYKFNQIFSSHLKSNLVLILATDLQNSKRMPTEEAMIEIFNMPSTSNDPEVASNLLSSHLLVVETALDFERSINKPCMVVWDSNNYCHWYVGICIADNND